MTSPLFHNFLTPSPFITRVDCTITIQNVATKSCQKILYCDSTLVHYTEVRFASFLSGGFITVIVVNTPEKNWQNGPLWHF